jgi:hypothetical protein
VEANSIENTTPNSRLPIIIKTTITFHLEIRAINVIVLSEVTPPHEKMEVKQLNMFKNRTRSNSSRTHNSSHQISGQGRASQPFKIKNG